MIGQNEGDYFQLCICIETCVQWGMEAVYMRGHLCSVRNGSCVYAWRLLFSEEWKLCICMETCVQKGIEAVYMHGDLCSLRN